MGEDADESWIVARKAVELISPAFGSDELAKEAILKRAGAGLIRARCRLKRIIKNNGMRTVQREENCPINTGFWERFSPSELGHSADWSAGDFAAKIYHDISGSTETQVFTVEFREADLRAIPGVPPARSFAVFPVGALQSTAGPRIDPFIPGAPGLTLGEAARYFANSDAASAPRKNRGAPERRRRAAKQPVSHPEFMDWYRALPDADRARGYRVIWAAANKHFRPRKVPKGWCEELSKGRKRGRNPMG